MKAYQSACLSNVAGRLVQAEQEYLIAVEQDKTDWKAVRELIQLYIKVGLPCAAKHYCGLYHTVLVDRDDLGAEDLRLLLAERKTFEETAKQDITTPRLRFQRGDRVLCLTDDGWKEGLINHRFGEGGRLVHGWKVEGWPAWKGRAPYHISLVDECNCDEYCTCQRFRFAIMDCDCLIRAVTAEYRQSLRRPPMPSAGPVDMAAVERELLPLLAPLDRRWLESTGNVSATISRLYKEYKQLIYPRKRLTNARSGIEESPAKMLSRLFTGKSDVELRAIVNDASLDRRDRAAARMALGDCLMLGVGRKEKDQNEVNLLYIEASELGYKEATVAQAILAYVQLQPPDLQNYRDSPVKPQPLWEMTPRALWKRKHFALMWQYLESVVDTNSDDNHLCLFLLWHGKDALREGYGHPLSNAMRSVLERQEDIYPTEIPPQRPGMGGTGMGGAETREGELVDYRALFKQGQASMGAGRFGHASQLFHRAVNALPPHEPKSKRARLVCMEMQCNFSLVEQASVSNVEHQLSIVLDAVSRLLHGQGEFELSDVPPDVAAKAYDIERKAQDRLSNLLTAVETEEPDVVDEPPDDFLADHEQMVRSQSSGGASARQMRRLRASRRERTNARSRAALGGSSEAEEGVMQGDHDVQSCEVLALPCEGVLALNAGRADDRCASCIISWGELAESRTLAVVLPCRHAVCLPCLSRQWNVYSGRGDNESRFHCGHCRGLLPPALVPNIAAEVLEQHSADSGLASLVQRLSMQQRAQKALLASLLVLENFDFSQVLAKLMDIVGYLGHERPDLSADKKREIIDKARKHERHLWEQLKQVRTELQVDLDAQSPQGRALRMRFNMLNEQVRAEAARAADDIFRQINEVGSMATETQGCVLFDLHGLKKVEALQKLEEIVLPVLPTLRRIMLITGRGLHSSRAEGQVHSVLKAAVGEYLQQRGLAVEPVPGNDGAVFALWRT
ncbi:hypothetical protein B484DRAFT_454976 [Ochromonadaceae sp. CCMP2298]|nr:hypothetical protein B484DRAFT_454976 [Ochromonadaceae sp. CCMP2298]